MNRILLIGNTGKRKKLNGQTIKVRLYKNLLLKEGIDFSFVELSKFKSRPISTLINIAVGIKKCERIVLLTAQGGAKFLIPFINFLNRKQHKPFILPMIGINILHKYVDSLSDTDHFTFMNDCNFHNISPKKKDIKQLKKITWILPENDSIKNVIRNFFKIDNVAVLENFRDFSVLEKRDKIDNNHLNVIFLSRVTKEKGIFNLIEAVKRINEKSNRIHLDIFGELYLDKNETKIFQSKLDENIQYCGSINNDVAIKTISAYDLFVFPTLYKGEGTPGVIAEAFIAGVPVLSSNFAQANVLMKDGFDSKIYSSSSKNGLEEALTYFLDKKNLEFLSQNVEKEKYKFSYLRHRSLFMRYVCGQEENN